MEGLHAEILDVISNCENDVAFPVVNTGNYFKKYNVPFTSLNLNVRVHKKYPFKLSIVALLGAKLFQSVLEFVDAASKRKVG